MHPIVRSVQLSQLKKVPSVKAGYTVRVSQKVKEGDKERIQRFEGLVIKVGHGEGVEKTFTVRKIVEGIGVEKVFLFHSPNITEIKVIKKAKVRRSKLYYMRERFGKSARLAERQVGDQERADEMKRVGEELQSHQGVEEKAETEAVPEEATAVETEQAAEPASVEEKVDETPQEEAPVEAEGNTEDKKEATS